MNSIYEVLLTDHDVVVLVNKDGDRDTYRFDAYQFDGDHRTGRKFLCAGTGFQMASDALGIGVDDANREMGRLLLSLVHQGHKRYAKTAS